MVLVVVTISAFIFPTQPISFFTGFMAIFTIYNFIGEIEKGYNMNESNLLERWVWASTELQGERLNA